MEWAWVPWTLTLVGWVVANQLGLRAQRRNFAMQAKNAARLEIVKSLRDYQSWLSDLTTMALSLPYSLDDIEQGKPWARPLLSLWEENRKRVHPENDWSSAWLMRLEEYEILFPKNERPSIRPLRVQQHARR